MDASKLREDLLEHFGDALETDEDAMRQCAEMCRTFHLSPEDLRFKWEALALARRRDIGPIDTAGARELKASLANELQAALKRADQARVRQRQAAAAPTARVAGPSGTGAGDVKPFANGAAFAPLGPLSTETRYKYMYEKIPGRSEKLDEHIEMFEHLVAEHCGVDRKDLGNGYEVTDDDVIVVGRICCDEDAKINEASIVLEVSREIGSGARVPIKFAPNVAMRGGLPAGQTGMGVFPGAMAAFRGRNGGGGWFVVNEILPLPKLPRKDEARPDDARICVAAGPYTYSKDFKFEPLQRLLQRVLQSQPRPTTLLLLGPFVDANHELIKLGDVDEHPRETFRREVLDRLRALRGIDVFLVPSVRDVVSNHAVFPQGELREEWALPQNVRMLPNPCVTTIGGLRVAATSVDVLFQIKKEEFVKDLSAGGGKADSFANLGRHILEQRSFYPLFPAPRDDNEVNLDVTHSELLGIAAPAPDVLVLPSKFVQFHKDVDGCAVVNPSFCGRTDSLGGYAEVVCRGGHVSVGLHKL
ncbi:DNA polymerase alpha, subunit B [Auricularia subglabra TFB-10046 SS5]|uniref:DNA polymerase alpha subunit B n=1 Tax=Auricularia subglabra (strain TFB-10046 / SS5) TaxID=717982 RepID=J0WYA5_AURST|nr:DNA polymerase alpha, subunit B [Auricularia subglabra TFB-10046 SS5]